MVDYTNWFWYTFFIKWPVRLMVRTLPSQGRNTGSIPVRATKRDFTCVGSLFCLIIEKILGSIMLYTMCVIFAQ